MEALHFIHRYPENNAIYFNTIDTEAVIHFLRGRDFCIEEVWELKGEKDGKLDEQQLGWPDEEPNWVRNNHHVELTGLMEDCENYPICYLKIKLDGGGYIDQCYGEFTICYGAGEDLKTPSLKILEMYGYYAAEKIWDLAGKHTISLPLGYLMGREPDEVTERELQWVVNSGEYIIEDDRKLDKMITEDD